ncbi:MAG: DNA polymerase IV [Gammaproteobacteria bacterium]
MSSSRLIAHVDMDAFYASIEQYDDPSLKGQPVVVGGSGPRGVVAAASYEVRKYGVRSAMPMRRALTLCPSAICIRPRFDRYKEVSQEIFDIFREFTPLVEGLSLDEAFLDLTDSLKLFGQPLDIGAEIKRRIHERIGLTASVGMAPNKLVAKIASELDKPDGLRQVESEQVAATLAPLPVRTLPGIGPRTAELLVGHGVQTLADLRTAPEAVLQPIFGRFATRMRQKADGIDDRPVSVDSEYKSISSEETFDEDVSNLQTLSTYLLKLTDQTTTRLRKNELLAGSVYVKLRTADFKTHTRQKTFSPPGQNTQQLYSMARELLETWYQVNPGAALRLLGVGVASLVPVGQLSLFAGAETSDDVDQAIDEVRDRFGNASIKRARGLE